MSTYRSRPAQLSSMHPPKSNSLSSLSSYLPMSPMSPPIASSSTLSYFPPFIPSEPPVIPPESSHRKNRSLSAIAGWSLNLSFGLGSSSGSSTPESSESARPPTPAQALSSSLHRPRHSTSSSRHVLQPVIDGHSQIKRSQSLRQSDRARSKRPARESECGVERDRRRGMELLLGVLGSKANGSEESLLDTGKENILLEAEAREPRAHRTVKPSSSSSYAPSIVQSPARPPFRPVNTTPHPGLRRANSARTHNQPPSSFRPLPQLSTRRPKPHLQLSLAHPSWSRPSPSPPITSLSPSLPSELFDFCVENPITPPISACQSPVIGGPLERTVSETETLRPSILTPRPLRQHAARPPTVETSSESESEDGELKTPCLSSSPVIADLQFPVVNNAKRRVKEVRRAPWR